MLEDELVKRSKERVRGIEGRNIPVKLVDGESARGGTKALEGEDSDMGELGGEVVGEEEMVSTEGEVARAESGRLIACF